MSAAAVRIHYYARDYDRAIEECLKTLEMDPRFAEAHINLAMAYAATSRFAEAFARLHEAINLTGARLLLIAMLGYVYARSGDHAQAQRTLDDLNRRAKPRSISCF